MFEFISTLLHFFFRDGWLQPYLGVGRGTLGRWFSLCKTALDAKVNQNFMDLVPAPTPSANLEQTAPRAGYNELD